MKIYPIDHISLKLPTKRVEEVDGRVRGVLDLMFETMKKSGGIGLSANQVGSGLSMFVMETSDGRRLDLVNPEILSRSEKTIKISEGCLSIPKFYMETENRSEEIEVRFTNKEGQEVVMKLTGMDAACVQHEMEHLEGKSFIDGLNRETRRKIYKKYL